MKRTAFTLIELLVVITIIVVLLALLTPALDKALYQAELVTCAANIDAQSTAATTYAFDHKRRYPFRDGVDRTDIYYRPYDLFNPSSATQGRVETFDLRIRLQDYFSINMYSDPLAGTVDLSVEATDANSQVLSSYTYLFGYKFTGYGGMTRIGDKLRWRDYTYNVLVADTQHYSRDGLMAFSHSDSDGVVSLSETQNSNGNLASEATGKITYTAWDIPGNPQHGSLDMNYGMQDGSVQRIAVPKGRPDLLVLNSAANEDYPLRAAPFIAQGGTGDYAYPNTIWLPATER